LKEVNMNFIILDEIRVRTLAKRIAKTLEQVPISRVNPDSIREIVDDHVAGFKTIGENNGEICSGCGRASTWHPDCPVCARLTKLEAALNDCVGQWKGHPPVKLGWASQFGALKKFLSGIEREAHAADEWDTMKSWIEWCGNCQERITNALEDGDAGSGEG
jgi:hypothetical protein